MPPGQPVLRYSTVAGVYRQTRRWAVVKLSVGYNGHIYSMGILKVDYLPFPILLGRDAPDFEKVLRNAMEATSISVSEGDAEAGPSGVEDNEDLL